MAFSFFFFLHFGSSLPSTLRMNPLHHIFFFFFLIENFVSSLRALSISKLYIDTFFSRDDGNKSSTMDSIPVYKEPSISDLLNEENLLPSEDEAPFTLFFLLQQKERDLCQYFRKKKSAEKLGRKLTSATDFLQRCDTHKHEGGYRRGH